MPSFFSLFLGFITMTPQLFINYKMKSVAHLPWRMLTYKALNTFIDDLFAFVIKMPMMYRIGCLRDGKSSLIYMLVLGIFSCNIQEEPFWVCSLIKVLFLNYYFCGLIVRLDLGFSAHFHPLKPHRINYVPLKCVTSMFVLQTCFLLHNGQWSVHKWTLLEDSIERFSAFILELL